MAFLCLAFLITQLFKMGWEGVYILCAWVLAYTAVYQLIKQNHRT